VNFKCVDVSHRYKKAAPIARGTGAFAAYAKTHKFFSLILMVFVGR
jgi:hypothetical protein